MQKPESTTTSLRFDPWLALNLATTGLMTSAMAYSLAPFVSIPVAFAVAIVLCLVFAQLARKMTSRGLRRSERLRTGLTALLIFLVSCGLTGSALYSRLFAASAALDWFAQARLPLQRQMSLIAANAETATSAFAAWKTDAAQKAKVEASGGGSCPAKAGSSANRGSIAYWREGEAGIADNLSNELAHQTVALRKQLDDVEAVRPTNYAELTAVIAAMNSAIETAETLGHGALTSATLGDSTSPGTLDRQLSSTIAWRDGEKFRCGDTARDELILRAKSALQTLAATPSLHPLVPGIDLADRQALTVRGLQRTSGMLCKVLTIGAEICFADDPLMAAAWKASGPLNRETLAWAIAALVEACVLITAAMVEMRGKPPMPFDLVCQVERWQQAAQETKTWWERLLLGSRAAMARALLNLFYTSATLANDAAPSAFVDPSFPSRELAWARAHLCHYLLPLHDQDYLVIPSSETEATTAARALCYHDVVEVVHFQATWDMLSEAKNTLHRKFRGLIEDFESAQFEVYKLNRDFAQALRLELLRLSTSLASA